MSWTSGLRHAKWFPLSPARQGPYSALHYIMHNNNHGAKIQNYKNIVRNMKDFVNI